MSDTPVAFFDFDGTLTRGDTLMPFLRYVVGRRTYYTRLALLSPVLTGYYLKLIRNDVAKQVVLKHYLKGYCLSELRRLGQAFGERMLPAMHRQVCMERLRWHQEQGHRCVLVSASLDIYLEHWARKAGFHHVICSQLEEVNGRVTGALRGSNCFGEDKVTRIKDWLADTAGGATYAYGNSAGDRFMLEFVDHGFLLQGSDLQPLSFERRQS